MNWDYCLPRNARDVDLWFLRDSVSQFWNEVDREGDYEDIMMVMENIELVCGALGFSVSRVMGINPDEMDGGIPEE